MTSKLVAKAAMGAAVAVFVAGSAGAVVQSTAGPTTPKSFSYELRDGKRVPKGNRVTNADGSWREEVRQGTCVTIKEKTAAGDYSETRKCD
ncbi:MAG: hypothetical protein ABIO85_04110 [Sphingomicrobium sp.]